MPVYDDQKMAIALSGGGSRAVAFHLGCLRALAKYDLLDKCKIMSTVSGGSVIGALYACYGPDFVCFEKEVRRMLRQGLVGPSFVTAFTTLEGLKAAISCFTSMTKIILRVEPFRRNSRTTILEKTMDRLLFSGRKISDLRTTGPLLVIVAAELRTGSAFYFSKGGSGCWRFGTLVNTDLTISYAVTASAAYPLFLPSLDADFDFRRKDGMLSKDRVSLSDGGVYDNMALAPLWPDRDAKVSLVYEKVDVIFACRAGYGPAVIRAPTGFLSRMRATFSTIHSRAQNFATNRLFDLLRAGELSCFCLAYLGQKDENLKLPAENLITKSMVDAYPTNFSSMKDEWIERLSKRGEQLMISAIKEHMPSVVRDYKT